MRRFLNFLPWRRRRMEDDLARELAYHVQRRAEELKRSGVSEAEAVRRARLELGGVPQVQEAVRDTWTVRLADQFSGDLRYAVRTLTRVPGFTVTAVVSLALGIGASAAIFSLADQVMFRSLPSGDSDRLVLLDWNGRALSSNWGTSNLLSYPMCRDIAEQPELFDGVFCRYPMTVNVSTGQQHEPVRAELVTHQYFSILGARPERGRLIDASDEVADGAHPVVVVSYAFWQNHLGGADDVVGRKVLINNHSMTVIGVAPKAFLGVDPFAVSAVWIPVMMKRVATPEFYELFDRRAFWMHVFARLRDGVTVEQAKAGLQPWFRRQLDVEMQDESFPRTTAEQRRDFLASTLAVLPASRGRSELTGVLSRPLTVLLIGTGLLLLLAMLNVAGLLVSRGVARGRELTTRLALGASRRRITGQLLVESVLLAVAGAVVGILAAPVISRGLVAFFVREGDLSFQLDLRVFAYAFLATLVAATLCGLAPILQVGRIPLITFLKERTPISGGVRLRKALVIGQLAFALLLLVGAGLFVQTVTRLYGKDRGFASAGVVMLRADFPSIGYAQRDAELAMQRLLLAFESLPGVERAAVANTQILAGTSSATVLSLQSEREGRIVTDRVLTMRVGPGFFGTLGARLVAGRDFDSREVRSPGSPEHAPRAIIVNRSFARRYFGERNPIGQRVAWGNRPDRAMDIEIIGVVEDFSRRTLREDAEQAFVSFWDRDSGDGAFYLRMSGKPESSYRSILAVLRDIDPRLPTPVLTTMEQQIDRSLSTERMLATLSSGFGAVALLLCVVGLFGVMSFVVTRRTHEIGVRLALGATRFSAMWLLVKETLVMISAGIAIALPAVWGVGRLASSQVYGVSPTDITTILIASGVVAFVTLGAAMLPAWRAGSVSPAEALRHE